MSDSIEIEQNDAKDAATSAGGGHRVNTEATVAAETSLHTKGFIGEKTSLASLLQPTASFQGKLRPFGVVSNALRNISYLFKIQNSAARIADGKQIQADPIQSPDRRKRSVSFTNLKSLGITEASSPVESAQAQTPSSHQEEGPGPLQTDPVRSDLHQEMAQACASYLTSMNSPGNQQSHHRRSRSHHDLSSRSRFAAPCSNQGNTEPFVSYSPTSRNSSSCHDIAFQPSCSPCVNQGNRELLMPISPAAAKSLSFHDVLFEPGGSQSATPVHHHESRQSLLSPSPVRSRSLSSSISSNLPGKPRGRSASKSCSDLSPGRSLRKRSTDDSLPNARALQSRLQRTLSLAEFQPISDSDSSEEDTNELGHQSASCTNPKRKSAGQRLSSSARKTVARALFSKSRSSYDDGEQDCSPKRIVQPSGVVSAATEKLECCDAKVPEVGTNPGGQPGKMELQTSDQKDIINIGTGETESYQQKTEVRKIRSRRSRSSPCIRPAARRRRSSKNCRDSPTQSPKLKVSERCESQTNVCQADQAGQAAASEKCQEQLPIEGMTPAGMMDSTGSAGKKCNPVDLEEDLRTALQLLLEGWSSYLMQDADEVWLSEMDNALSCGYNKDALAMMSNRYLSVWGIIDDMVYLPR